MGGESFKTLIGQSTNWMKKKASEDPAFREQTQDYFLSDINQTVTAMRRRLPPSAVLSYQNGRFTIIMESTQYGANAVLPGGKDIPTVSNESLPLGLRVEDLNSKLASLKVLGPMGQEIVDTVVQQELNPNGVRGAAGDINLPGNPGADTLQSNGSIAQNLGIDFGTVEQEYGLPSGFLERIAMIESSGNPKAQNPSSSACGLFQQIDSNAKAYGVADRFDPMQSTVGAAKFAKDNANTLRKVLGREPTGGELYLAHQQGPGGASKLLSNPTALAVDIVGEKAVKLNGGNSKMTAGEFANIWISKFNGQRGQTSYVATETPTLNTGGATATSAPQGTPAAGAPQMASGGVSEPLASPNVEESAGETPEVSEDVKAKALAYIKSKPMDAEVKALIEALIGAKNV